MARLNEDPAPTAMDANEIIRRKYIRQNKEIARVNQAQSVRISNLENEISRLLTENLTLREQLIRQQSEMNHVSDVKLELSEKLEELVSLVSRFGEQPPRQKRYPRERVYRKSLTKSPDQKNWKNKFSLSETMDAQEGRLPPILEDQAQSARRLREEELDAILLDAANDNTDSPDIGPPPVSQFINEEPVKIDLPRGSRTEHDGHTGFDLAHSINLEQRKKRKDMSATSELKRAGRFEPQTQSAREVAKSLKVGAKRKLHVRDDEEPGIKYTATELSPNDFMYAQRVAEDHPEVKNQAGGEVVSREMAIARPKSQDKTLTNVFTNRKALGTKNANNDVTNSPRKMGKSQLLEEVSVAKEAYNDAFRELLPDGPPTVTLKRASTRITHDQTAPETPAGQDLFSPSSNPSAARPESRDTPPPSDLGPGMEGQRPNRRARASVSYAEPNLRDKMRRPTNELVDAVTGEGKSQRNGFSRVGDDANMVPHIKEEPEVDDGWKSMPGASSVNVYATSPLIDKVAALSSDLDSMIPQRRRRASQLYSSGDDEMRSGSGQIISVLLAGTRAIKEEPKEPAKHSGSTLEKDMAHLDIYEFSSSSPREEGSSKIPTINEDRKSTRTTRRLSALPQDKTTATTSGMDAVGQNLYRSSSTSSMRKHSLVAKGGSTLNAEDENQWVEDMGMKRLNPVTLKVETVPIFPRSGGRRRSMM